MGYDPNWTDAVRDDNFEDLGFALGLGDMARSLLYWLHPQSTTYLPVTSDESADTYFTNWALTACKPKLDTDSSGWVYFKYTDAGATGTLDVYRGAARDGSAGNEKVASSGSTANNATMTLTPESGYTLAGTVSHGAPGGSFNWRAQIVTPARVRCEQLWDNTSASDSDIRSAFINRNGFLSRMRDGFKTALLAAQDGAAYVLRNKINPLLPIHTGTPGTIIDEGISQNAGLVEMAPKGDLYDLELAMRDNTGGSAAIEAQASTLAGAVSYPGTWAGKAVTPTYGQRGTPCVITGQCVQALSTSGGPQFELTRAFTDIRRAPGDPPTTEKAPLRLWTGKQYKLEAWGIAALTIDYLASVANVTSAVLSTTAGDWAVTGLRSDNSNGGILYARYFTSDTTLRFYRSSTGRTNADPEELVAQVTLATNAVNTAFPQTDENDSGLVITGKTGAGSGGLLVNGAVGDVNFNPAPATDPAGAFKITVTETTKGGAWVRNLALGGVGGKGWKPNTGSGLDIIDGQITRGMPFVNPTLKGERFS